LDRPETVEWQDAVASKHETRCVVGVGWMSVLSVIDIDQSDFGVVSIDIDICLTSGEVHRDSPK